jgi:hypothetical protein
MKSENILILAALGFGAYYFTRQKATAQPLRYPTNASAAQQQAQQQQQTGSLIAQGIGALGSLFGMGSSAAKPAGYVNALTNYSTTPGQAGYGWQYFDNGTSIAPTGEYYFGGEKVWAPDALAINPANSYMTQDMYQMNEF